MKQEYSYGAVVYTKENDNIKVLIEHMVLGHISIPKGHIEEGETPLTCTLREIKEETNLDVDIDTNFSYTVSYSPKPGIIKDVTFFVATPKTFDIISQPEEVTKAEWVDIDTAISLVTFDTDKETLKKAKEYLLSK